MKFSITVKDKEVQASLKKIVDEYSKSIIGAALRQTGNQIRNTAVTNIKDTGGRSGNFRLFVGQGKDPYYASDKPANPRKLDWNSAIKASAEGEYPAANTGNLHNSIVIDQPNNLIVKVIAGAKYAWYLENNLNRPFMQMSLEANKDNLMKNMDLAMDKIMARAK